MLIGFRIDNEANDSGCDASGMSDVSTQPTNDLYRIEYVLCYKIFASSAGKMGPGDTTVESDRKM